MSKFLFVLEIDPLREGARLHSFPLHCTLVPWFKTALTVPELTGRVRAVFERVSPIELVSKESAKFGDEGTVAVHTVQDRPELISLHWELLRVLFSVKATHVSPKWIGHAYRPHVSSQRSRAFLPGSRHVVRHVALIGKWYTPCPERRVCARFDLRAPASV